MPIRLNEPNTVKEYSPQEGVVFRYRESKSAQAHRAILATRDGDGRPDLVAAEIELLARCLVGWEGIETPTGEPIPFPSSHADIVVVIEALPLHVVIELLVRVQARAVEAASSGKDSARP